MSGFSSQDHRDLSESSTVSSVSFRETLEADLSDVYDLERCITWIQHNGFQRTCLQFPNDLLNDGVAVTLYLEKALGKTFYLLADSAFGSCCVDHISTEHVNGDSIIHFGHACLSCFSKIPVLYIFEKKNLDLMKLKSDIDSKLPHNSNIILFYDDVYFHLHQKICDFFSDTKNVIVSKIILTEKDKSTNKSNFIFGRCYQNILKSDWIGVFLGGDCLLLQNLALALPDGKWYMYWGEEISAYNINISKFLMKKYHQVELVKDANVIGILIGTLGIENYLNAIDRIKELARKRGKKSYILSVGRPNVNKLANFPEVDVFVSIACTENVSKDFKDYYKPVVSLFEAEIGLGSHSFPTKYINDFEQVLSEYSTLPEDDFQYETNVSLTSGRARTTSIDNKYSGSTEVQEKVHGDLIEMKGAQFLQSRSWQGLEQNLGSTEVLKMAVGRSGIALGYENERDVVEYH